MLRSVGWHVALRIAAASVLAVPLPAQATAQAVADLPEGCRAAVTQFCADPSWPTPAAGQVPGGEGPASATPVPNPLPDSSPASGDGS